MIFRFKWIEIDTIPISKSMKNLSIMQKNLKRMLLWIKGVIKILLQKMKDY